MARSRKSKRPKEFDPHKRSFNPLKPMTYRKARASAPVFYGSECKDMLTVRNGKRVLTRMLLQGKYLAQLPRGVGYDERDDKLRRMCLLIEDKQGRQCTPDDVALLAQ